MAVIFFFLSSFYTKNLNKSSLALKLQAFLHSEQQYSSFSGLGAGPFYLLISGKIMIKTHSKQNRAEHPTSALKQF